MKKLLIILFLLITVNIQAQQRENIYGLRYDYILHYETSLIMSLSLSGWLKDKDQYGIASILFPLSIGVGKEFIDYRNSNCSRKDCYRDFACDILGCITGRLLYISF